MISRLCERFRGKTAEAQPLIRNRRLWRLLQPESLAVDSVLDFVQPCSLSLQVLPQTGLGDADCSSQRNFGQVVAVQAGDIRVIGGRQRVLGLHHFDVVCNSRAEPVARLLQSLVRQRYRAFFHRDFLRRGIQIEISVANLLVDLGAQVFEYLPGPLQRGVGAQNVAVHFSALKNGDAEGYRRIQGAVGGSGIDSSDSVVGCRFNRRVVFCELALRSSSADRTWLIWL